MREVQFRGKAKDNRWYYGHYLKTEDVSYCVMPSKEVEQQNVHHYILFDEMMDWDLPYGHYEVDVFRDTVGQWTGLYDKNKKRIYEGDIVKKRGKDGRLHMMPVRFNDGHFECWYNIGEPWDYTYSLVDSKIEVVGNIYDNPELVAK